MVVASSKSNPFNHYFIVSDDQGSREYSLTGSKYTLGRKSSCTINLHSQFVSRLHATLLRCLRNDGRSYYRILDGDGYQQNSANGIIVNGKKVNSHELKHGDEIVFGPQVYGVYEYRQEGESSQAESILEEEDPFDITLIDPAMIEEDEGHAGDDVSTQLLGMSDFDEK
ncbi:MAG: FHA domain-containing protein [Limnothrix sp.]